MQTEKLLQRVRWLRYLLPPTLVLLVVLYQLGVAESVERIYGLRVHYWIEIAFYSLSGPVVTGLTLVWIERQLQARRRLEQALESIREEERSRIGRDLHDGVAQTLYLLALRTDMLQTQGKAIPPAMQDELKHMGSTLRQCIREIRRTIFALRPFQWDEDAFPDALQSLVEGYAAEMGWEAHIEGRLRMSFPTARRWWCTAWCRKP